VSMVNDDHTDNRFYREAGRFPPIEEDEKPLHLLAIDYAETEMLYEYVKPKFQFNGLEGEAWLYVGLCAAVGVLCLVLAGLVYRRRNLENAGDFISLRPLAPLFMLVCTVGAGAFLYMFSDLVGNQTYLFLVLGMAIGYFAGKMLLNRTLKVFGKKSLLSFAALVAVFAGSFLVTYLDPLGVTTYIPKSENIKTAYIYGADKGYYYLSDSFISYVGNSEEGGFEITEAEDLVDLQDFHRQLTRYRPAEDDGVLCDVRIHYKLKSGRTVTRYYEVGRETPLGQRAGKYFNDMRYIFEVKDTQILYDAFEAVAINIYENGSNVDFKLTDSQEIAGLLNAIAQDCEEGTMAQNWAYHDETGKARDYNVEFYVKDSVFQQGSWATDRFHLRIWDDSTNTVEYLKTMCQLHGEEEEPPATKPILDPLPE